jgi:hypothetical protein
MPLYVERAMSYIPFERVFLMYYRFFLINAAIVVVLGAVWKQKQSCRQESSPVEYDQSRELAAIDTAIRVLDFCGQRNAFARRYSTLVKELRQKLSRGSSSTVSSVASPSSAASRVTSQGLAPYNRGDVGPPELSQNSDSTGEGLVLNNLGATVEQNSTSTSPLTNADLGQNLYASIGLLNMGLEPWSDQDRMFYPTDDMSSYGILI